MPKRAVNREDVKGTRSMDFDSAMDSVFQDTPELVSRSSYGVNLVCENKKSALQPCGQ
jgi:hypothetical protein